MNYRQKLETADFPTSWLSGQAAWSQGGCGGVAETIRVSKELPGWLKHEEWRRLPFGAFAENVNVRVEPADAPDEVYVGLEHLDSGNLHIRRWGLGRDVIGTKLRFRKGDLIFGRRRAYQRKLAVAEMDGICSAHALVVRAKPEFVLPEFLPFLMMSDKFMNRAVEISVGSLSPTINWTTLKLQEFALPPLDQQRRIAGILWVADTTIQCFLHAAADIAAADLYLSKALFTKTGATHNNEIRLGDFIELISGQHIASEDYSDQPPGVPYITGPADFPNGVIKVSRYTNEPKVCCEKGDILVTCKGSGTGKLVIADGKYCISRQLMAVRARELDPLLLFKILSSFSEQLNLEAKGLIPGISRSDILEKQVSIPPKQEQEQWRVRFDLLNIVREQFLSHMTQIDRLNSTIISNFL